MNMILDKACGFLHSHLTQIPKIKVSLMLTALLLPVVCAWADKRVEKDLDKDSRVDQVAIYNDAGVILKVESDKDQDGFFESLQTYQEGKIVRIERDTDNDRKTDSIDHLENEKRTSQERLDSKGNPVQVCFFDETDQITLMKKDTTGDGKFDTIYHFNAGILLDSARDTNGNEKSNVFCTYKNQLPVEQEIDDNEDGVMDRVLLFNAEGELEKMYKEPFANGKYKVTGFFEKGEIITQERDANEDAKPDDITRFKKGVPFEQEKDTNFDGKTDYYVDFDDKGEIQKTREDTNENGKTDRIRYFRAGSLYRIEQDGNDDGFFETVSVVENNKIIKNIIDKNQDGKADMEVFFNENQEKKRLIADSDFDGFFETTQAYDNPSWTTIVSLDVNRDKKTDVRSFFKDTVLRQKEIDEDSDGVIDIMEIYNSKGELERVEEKKSGKTVLSWFYEKEEVLVRGEEDKNQDGKTEIWYLYENNKLKTVQEDTNFDGKPDLWEDYDEIEALVKRAKDLDSDGTPDYTDIARDVDKDS